MAATVLMALKELHTNDQSVAEHISQGCFFHGPNEIADISRGGILVIVHKGMTYEKTTEYIHKKTGVDLLYFSNSLETLDQLVLPWVAERFDDADPSVLLEGAETVSVDLCPEGETIMMGQEAEKDAKGANVFSMTVPLTVWAQYPRVGTERSL